MLLFHGDNHVLSRNELNSLIFAAKKQKKEIIRFSGKNLTLENLVKALESQSLFDQDRLVIIEEFFSQPKSKKQEEIIEYLRKEHPRGVKFNASGVNILFWEKKTLTPAVLRKLPFIQKHKVFKIPALVFKLAESIYPGNQKQTLSYLRKLLNNQSLEFTFYMIARQIRLLIQVKDKVFPGMAPWMLGKLKSQAGKFKSITQLKKIYKKLLEIDRNIKTGKTPMNLAWHLDIWLINNLD